MSNNPENEYSINFFEWDSTLKFELKEACELMCREVVRNADIHLLPKPPIEKMGTVVGVLFMNDEFELIVRFIDEIHQLSKTEFCGDFKLVPEIDL